MAKFYNIRVIESDSLKKAISGLSSGEGANFIETDEISDVVLPLNDLWRKIPVKKLVSLNPDRRIVIKLEKALKDYSYYCYLFGQSRANLGQGNLRPMKSFDNWLKTEI